MTPIELLPYVTEVLIACALGLLGSTLRIFVQYLRDGELPATGLGLYAESFIGASCGFLSWLFIAPVGLRAVAIAAITAGYAGADFVDNTLGKDK